MPISSLISSPTLFLAEKEKDLETSLSFCLLLNGQLCHMMQKKINGNLTSLIHQTYENIGVKIVVRCMPLTSQQEDEGAALKRLYDLVISLYFHI